MMPTLNFLRVMRATALSSVTEKWHLLCRSMSKQNEGGAPENRSPPPRLAATRCLTEAPKGRPIIAQGNVVGMPSQKNFLPLLAILRSREREKVAAGRMRVVRGKSIRTEKGAAKRPKTWPSYVKS